MSLRVFWSDRLEELADKMLDEWIDRPVGGNPFERTCVAVGNMATRNWLKDRFLLHRAPGRRRVLANVDFKPLPELVNDWLAAAVGATGAGPRDPADHPFSKGVMAWRIDAILREKADDSEFKTLADYIDAGGDAAADRRRFDLATRLAQMFDDYLVSRHAKLSAWERGNIPSGGDERWQALLYRELTKNAGSYAADYAKALATDFDPGKAFGNGFPRYAAVHVFDVMDAPWPYLAMLKRISETIPVTFWTFNPSRGFWIENPPKREAIREKAALLRKALASGESPENEPEDPDFSSPDSRLLGALAMGTRGMLANQLDLTDGDCEWLGDDEDFAALRAADTEVHVCHSPRRELEAARDALHDFFRKNEDAKPSDALVLCADWKTYSPLIEAVFGGNDGKGGDDKGLPVVTAGIAASSPIAHSFSELLDFRKNRFEVTKVFALLGLPEIRAKFGIGAEGLSVLRDMVSKDNIHWGFDDDDVRSVLGQEEKPEDERSHFTWQRGLDRLTLDALLGPRKDEDALYEAGALGQLLPRGNVESDRATLVGGLFRFTKRLMRLRGFLQKAHAAADWREGLLSAIDDFYLENDDALGELLGLRRAVDATAEAAIRACETDGRPSGENISGEVFCAAVGAAVRNRIRPLSSVGDAVRIAPLSNGSAVPARFVWICGLNDGTFPRKEYRPTFDLVDRHPTMYDVTPRERDALALLKAALGARRKLCLSYVGRDIHTNQELPAAVPLIDLLEWFQAPEANVSVKTYVHPLQSYSGKYFLVNGDFPRSYSKANHDAAAVLAAGNASEMTGEDSLPEIIPFPLDDGRETEIELDDLADFCGGPNWFLATKRLQLLLPSLKRSSLDDEEFLDQIAVNWAASPLLTESAVLSDETVESEAERLVEQGAAFGSGAAAAAIRQAVSSDAIETFRSLVVGFAQKSDDQMNFGCPNDPLYRNYLSYLAQAPEKFRSAAFDIGGRTVRIVGAFHPPAMLTNASGNQTCNDLVFFDGKPYTSEFIKAWIRHLVRQIVSGPTARILFWPNVTQLLVPVPNDEAKRRLSMILELATKKTPVNWRQTGKEDKLPEAYAESLDYNAYLKYKNKKGNGKKGGAEK